MKKKLAWALVLMTAMTALSGCGEKKEETGSGIITGDYSAIENSSSSEENSAVSTAPSDEISEPLYDFTPYKQVLNDLWLIVNGLAPEEFYPDGSMGVREASAVYGSGAPECIGFSLKDMTGDGTPELLVGTVDNEEPSLGSNLYAVYTLTPDGPFCTLSGWDRNAYYLAGNGFFYSGSGGAAYSVFGSYLLSGDGLYPICTDYYFTKEKDGDPETIGYYHNTTGYWDTDVSEEMTADEYWQRYDEMSAEIVSASLIPFAKHDFTGEIPEKTVSSAPAAPAAVTVGIRPAEDQLQYYPEYAWFAAEDTPYAEEVLLTAENGSVKDVKVYALELHSADDENIYFACEELFALDELTVERPLALKVSFPGSIPLYGISYTGTDGETVWRSLNMSGKDGSYYLNIFSPAE